MSGSLPLLVPIFVTSLRRAETMALALEGRLENFSLGDNISPDKVALSGTWKFNDRGSVRLGSMTLLDRDINIGTSKVSTSGSIVLSFDARLLATQTLIQKKAKNMLVRIEGQLGLGVTTLTVQKLFSQGGFSTTGLSPDLAIQGNGLFVLKGNHGGEAGTLPARPSLASV